MDVPSEDADLQAPRLMDNLIRQYANQSDDIAAFLCKNKHDVNVLRDLYCGDFPVRHQRGVEIFVWTAFSVLIAVALIGNAIVMYLIARVRAMHHTFNIFLFNIAVADFLMAFFNVGSTWTFNFYYDWWFGDFCKLNHFFGVAPTCISVFTMMVVSHDRCMAIVDPLGKKAMSRKKGCLLILFIWIIAGVLSFPNVISARVETKYYYSGVITQRRFCSVDFQYKFLYDNLLFVAQYAIPLLVLTYTYARILLALRNIKFPSAARVNISRNHMRDKQKAIKMLGLVVVIFMVSWFPYQVYHMHPDKFMKNPQVGTYCYLFFYWLAMSACACNPLIYFCFNARFRIGFTYVFRWLPGVRFTEANRQEIFPDCSRNHHTSIRMRQVNTPESPLHPKSPTNFVRSNSPNSPISATSLTLN